MISVRLVVGLLGFAMLAAGARAQTVDSAASAQADTRWSGLASTVFRQVARDTDLPDSAIPIAMSTDGAGFLWVGSEDGMARWDGYHFRLYRAGGDVQGALPDSLINALHRDAQGRLWAGTDAGGLVRYSDRDDRFTQVQLDPAGTPVERVAAITDDGAGGLFVGTGRGLYRLDSNGHMISHVTVDPAGPDAQTSPAAQSLPDRRILSLLHARDGSLWVGTQAGLARTTDGVHFRPITLPAAGSDVPMVTYLIQDTAGSVWIGTRHDGAYVVEAGTTPGAGPVRAITETQDNGAKRPADYVKAILEIRPGEIWIATHGHGIVDVLTDGFHVRRIRHDPNVPVSLPDDSVTALFRDSSGFVWVGTDHGVSLCDPGQTGILTVYGKSSRADGLTSGDVYSILPRPDGHVWVGQRQEGIDILDPNAAVVGALQPNATHPETALPARDIGSMAALEPGGYVLVASWGGLYRVDSAGIRIQRLTIAGRKPDEPVFVVRVDHGSAWIGGPDGLWHLAIAPDGQTTVLRHVDGGQLTDERISAIAIAPTGAIWAGTANGLNFVPPNGAPIEAIPPDRTNPAGLIAGHIMSLAFDDRGRLWVGTLDAGIDVLEGRDAAGHPRFRQLSTPQGLVNNDINSIQFDQHHKAWVSTDNGLATIDPADFSIRTLQRADGVAIAGYWNGAGAVTSQGEVLFGGLGGMTVIRPDLTSRRAIQAPMAVTSVQIGGKPLQGVGDALSTDGLQIHPGANSLAVEFAVLDYAAPELIRYSYRLEGFDPDWIETDTTHRLASYTNLPPGRYTLRLRGSDRTGKWTALPVSVPIHVLPAWYQTVWFMIAEAIGAIVAIGLLVQGRTAFLRQRQLVLERMVAERTQELRKRTAELSASQSQLRHLAYMDALTGLPNRRAFNERFHDLIDSEQRTPRAALLLVDLDKLKAINDSLGHAAGDDLLMTAASRLRNAVREGDDLARLGGDEFAILLPDLQDVGVVENVCRRIMESFADPLTLSGQSVRMGASIGIALFPKHAATQEGLYKCADEALYAAKREGRGSWRWFHDAEKVEEVEQEEA